MTALGQKRKWARFNAMSALAPIADIVRPPSMFESARNGQSQDISGMSALPRRIGICYIKLCGAVVQSSEIGNRKFFEEARHFSLGKQKKNRTATANKYVSRCVSRPESSLYRTPVK